MVAQLKVCWGQLEINVAVHFFATIQSFYFVGHFCRVALVFEHGADRLITLGEILNIFFQRPLVSLLLCCVFALLLPRCDSTVNRL